MNLGSALSLPRARAIRQQVAEWLLCNRQVIIRIDATADFVEIGPRGGEFMFDKLPINEVVQ